MNFPTLAITLALTLAMALPSAYARGTKPPVEPIEPGTLMGTKSSGDISIQGNNYDLSTGPGKDLGLLVPDMDGNYVYVPNGKRPKLDPGTVNAQELKLKVRELASQLLDTWPNGSISGLVALPTSFVSLHDFDETSSLGRYMAEALFYEFNTRGFATREYRASGIIDFNFDGEYALSRDTAAAKIDGSWATIIVGTYLRDRDAIFINARMIRPSDGLVLRTAQLVMPMNPLLGRLSTPIMPHPLKRGAAYSNRTNGGVNGLRIVPGRK